MHANNAPVLKIFDVGMLLIIAVFFLINNQLSVSYEREINDSTFLLKFVVLGCST